MKRVGRNKLAQFRQRRKFYRKCASLFRPTTQLKKKCVKISTTARNKKKLTKVNPQPPPSNESCGQGPSGPSSKIPITSNEALSGLPSWTRVPDRACCYFD